MLAVGEKQKKRIVITVGMLSLYDCYLSVNKNPDCNEEVVNATSKSVTDEEYSLSAYSKTDTEIHKHHDKKMIPKIKKRNLILEVYRDGFLKGRMTRSEIEFAVGILDWTADEKESALQYIFKK